jgi:hypothetical protein
MTAHGLIVAVRVGLLNGIGGRSLTRRCVGDGSPVAKMARLWPLGTDSPEVIGRCCSPPDGKRSQPWPPRPIGIAYKP